MKDAITLKNVAKSFGETVAVRAFDLSVPQGALYGLIGPNGAGKTTLIRMFLSILFPDKGELNVLGHASALEAKNRIGYLPEERGLYKKMRVGDFLAYIARLKGMDPPDLRSRIRHWLDRMDLSGTEGKRCEELSKGMQQKIQFIVTVIHEPELLIFDEPFSGFDPINVNILKEEILRLRDQGATIIFSTHNMASVEELCDHIALLNRSEKILEGRMADIKNTYRTNAFIVRYDGTQNSLRPILHPSFQILEENLQEKLKTARIRLPKDASPNGLIESLLPHVTIHGFSELLPTMNEIFISKVNEFSTPSR